MATPSGTVMPGLNAAWTAYRTWAATARHHKAEIDFWNRWGLRLAVAGAVLAALGEQLAPLAPPGGPLAYVLRAPGVLGAAVIALAAHFSAQGFAAHRDRLWIRCRAAAESIKSAIYLYRAAVSPFDTPARTAEIRTRVENLLKELGDVEARQPDPDEKVPPLGPLTVADYVGERVTDQIRWYRKRAAEFQAESDRYRIITRVLGALSALVGLASAVSVVAGWVAVIATMTASITAYVKSERYQVLIGMYQSTATRLELLKDEWADSGKTDADKADRDAFIRRCEETMAIENSAWVAQWKEQPPAGPAQPSPADSPRAVEPKPPSE